MSNGPPYQVQAPTTELIELLTRYGVITPPALWFLNNSITPVAIVDSRVDLTAISQAGVYTLATQGELTNPTAGLLVADTGQLAAGTWEFFLWISHGQNAINSYRMEHRNAANSASLNSHLFTVPGNEIIDASRFTLTLAVNERLRVIIVSAATGICQATIWRRLIS